jgi:fatty-acyl-CoA synthase
MRARGRQPACRPSWNKRFDELHLNEIKGQRMSAVDISTTGGSRDKPFRLGQAAWLRALERTAPLHQRPEHIFPALLDELAGRFGNTKALISEREAFSFVELAERANRYSRWALEQNLAPGTVIGLMMPNRPEYLAIWLGITRIGCVAALLNTNLARASLAHCIGVVGARHLIVADEFTPALATALPLLKSAPEVWVYGVSQHFRSIEPALKELSGAALQNCERRKVTLTDRALCIYTSGTTGLPKAANVSHHRIMAWSHWFAGMMDTRPDDRLYNCLPFYHAIGGVAASGALLTGGGSVFIREKFSAKSFWQEVCEQKCTVFQYIGELCRYLVNGPVSPYEHGHQLRLCCGNGLGGDIWQKFKERFQVPHILEFYAATEANFSLYNFEEEPGAIGRIPAFLIHRFPIKLIKMNAEALEPIRNNEGLCIPAAAGEAGEAVFRIAKEEAAGAASFEGYTSAADSGKKVLHNVLAKGDAWFRSGDLMRKDARGFFYFIDRIGDTFRWKGENVSTSEVMHAISACAGVNEATVYGVALPNTEGRAGMAAIAIDGSFDLAVLKAHLDECLPRYAQPLFLRIIGGLDLTSTFRPKKSDFAAQGYNPEAIEDALYFNDPVGGKYIKLDAPLYDEIVKGRIKL